LTRGGLLSVSLQRRLFAETQQNGYRKERAITELMRESYDNPHVKAYLDAWMAGGYENLEMALCAMAACLSKENTRLRDCIIKDLETRPQTPFIFKG